MYCVVQNCRSVWKPNSDIKFHSFPKDVVRRKTWLAIIPLKGKFYLSAKICSLHFKPEDYEPGRPGHLLNNAAPYYISYSCDCLSTLTKASSIPNVRSSPVNTDSTSLEILQDEVEEHFASSIPNVSSSPVNTDSSSLEILQDEVEEHFASSIPNVSSSPVNTDSSSLEILEDEVKENFCRCCLLRPPDKDMKTAYSRLGQSELYADMLKECFEIDVLMNDEDDDDAGICEVCIMRLRDACDFKQQVQHCQKVFQKGRLNRIGIKDESLAEVKQEIMDNEEDNAIYFLDLNDELSDYDELKGEDDKKLAEILGFNDVTIKKKHATGKRRVTKKRSLLMEKALKDKKPSRSMKISLRAISQRIKMLKPVKVEGSERYIPDGTKHKVNIENILKYSNCTPFLNKSLSGIHCAYCKEAYPDLLELKQHILLSHENDTFIDGKRMDKSNLSIKLDITDLKCNICSHNFDVISDLKAHLIKHHDVKFYPDVNDYILEFKLAEDRDMMNCALCNSTFETFKMLLQHMNGHYRNFVCEVCDMGFINKHKLRNHQRTHEIGTFNCSFCEKVFTTRVRKLCHEKYTHNSNARYTTNCPLCDQSFTSYYRRNRHMTEQHQTSAATYKCNICDKSFILKSKLTSHIKKVHLMERNHVCPECGHGFFIKQSLDEHMIKHNGERVFKCTECQKAYARKKTLREHMRIHNNDRRFKCGVCALAFVQKCSLKSHMLSNHGVTLAEYESRSG